MMLEINLLPGARKGKSGSSGINLAASFSAISANIRDPWLIAAAVGVMIAVGTVGTLFTAQNARASEIEARLQQASRDSTRYAKVLAARRKLTAERDSVMRQLSIIRTIDDSRFNWAHILDEVSRALPAYTWLTTIEQTTRAPTPAGTDTVASAGATPVATAPVDKKEVAPDTIAIHPPLGFRLVGQTVDIQALTMFMRQLESSPFVQQVALSRSEIVVLDGKDITQFELRAEYEVPPPGVVRTLPLVVPVR